MLGSAYRFEFVTADEDQLVPACPSAGGEFGRDRGDDAVYQVRRSIAAGDLERLQVQQQVTVGCGTSRDQAGKKVTIAAALIGDVRAGELPAHALATRANGERRGR